MTVYLGEIRPALENPAFDPTMVILLLYLPRVGLRDCRVATLSTANDAIDEIAAKSKGHIKGTEVLSLKDEMARLRARGLTAIVKIEADSEQCSIWVEGLYITPAIQA